MKKIILSILAVGTLFSCLREKKQNEQTILEISAQNDSLQYVVNSKDSIINDALLTISDISSSLSDIKRREGLVISQAELGKTPKDQIREDLNDIADILKKQKAELARLERASAQLAKANIKIDGLQKLVEEMTRQVKEKDATIAAMIENINNLKEEIHKLNSDIQVVKENNQTLSREVEQSTTDLNTAYYITGNEKYLIEAGILVKKGAIGRTLVINPDIDKSKLTKIDIRNVDRIEIKGKKVDIIGGFPASAYTLEEGSERKSVNALLIKDKEQFWNNSKILVISYK